MLIAGIDYDSRAIHLVLIDQEGGRPPWYTPFPLYGQDAWERTRTVRRTLPGPTSQLWEEVIAFGLEEPRGHNTGVLYRIQGAVLASLPHAALVYPLVPSRWRVLAGLAGNASKAQVYAAYGTYAPDLPQDAADAHAIAVATASLIEQQKEAA